ncbi:MAG: prolipoprotein diacylglyceryl transferase [Jatrophihabitantaceae bacterium]
MSPLAAIPSPTRSVWHLGPLPIRAYALCIVAGIVVAVWLTARRWRERGGTNDDVWDVAGWAVIFGIVGGRLYHVLSDPELYFGAGKHPVDALKIWDGGLGIWGAIALGGLGAWIGCRRKSMSLIVFADAAVPGVVLAQGIGRWGNWFNNELFGGATSLPWKLQIHCMDTFGHAQAGGTNGTFTCAEGSTVLGYFQPTFLYESLWDIGLAALLLYADRRWRLGRGNVAALYAMGYTAGRAWIEALRTDPANHILGVRLNDWTALIVFLIALAWFVRHGGLHAGREATPYTGRDAVPDADGVSAVEDDADSEAGESDDSESGVDAHGRRKD